MSTTIFVTGATGVLGRATVPLLLAQGYAVRALSRSVTNDAAIRALGADPVRGDLFDTESLGAAMAGAEAILHLATRIPATSDMRHRRAWAENDRIRAKGTHNLVEAGMAAGAKSLVYPSFAFVYPDSGDAWIDAATTAIAPIETVDSTLEAEREVARLASADADGERRGIALRLGGLYGASVPSTLEQVALARRGMATTGGSGDAFVPTLWIDDAASALVTALERAPSGLYDVVDDEPLRHRELSRLMPDAVGRRWLFSPPLWLLRASAGPAGPALSRSLRISNRRFKQASKWAPGIANAREGVSRMLAEVGTPDRSNVSVGVKAGLWILAIFSLLIGLQQQFMPRAFYDTFPEFGMHWVSVDGLYNEHFVRDLGGASLAKAILIFYTIAKPTVGLVRAVAVAVLVSQTLHFVYHALHLGAMPTTLDQILQTASLLLIQVIPILLLVGTRSTSVEGHDATLRDAGSVHIPSDGPPRLVAKARSSTIARSAR